MNEVSVEFLSLNELHKELVCDLLESIKAGLFFAVSEAKRERIGKIIAELSNRLECLDMEGGVDELMKDRYFKSVYDVNEDVKELEFL